MLPNWRIRLAGSACFFFDSSALTVLADRMCSINPAAKTKPIFVFIFFVPFFTKTQPEPNETERDLVSSLCTGTEEYAELGGRAGEETALLARPTPTPKYGEV